MQDAREHRELTTRRIVHAAHTQDTHDGGLPGRIATKGRDNGKGQGTLR